MTSPFHLADRIFANASVIRVFHHQLVVDPINELMKETGRLFGALQDVGDDFAARSLKMKIWQLRAVFIFTLLPFDCEDLPIEMQLRSIKSEAAYLPFLSQSIEALARIVGFLRRSPANPKREKVFELLINSRKQGSKVGLVAALTRGPTPGWPERAVNEIHQKNPACEIILSQKMLRNSVFDDVIIPAGGRLSPFIYELYHGCRCAQLHIVAYKREGFYPPERKGLPKGTQIRIRSSRSSANVLPGTIVEDSQIDEWMNENFWESLRQREQSYAGTATDRQFYIKARAIVLTNNSLVHLRDEMKVIEISDLVERRISIEELGTRFPRRRVNELQEGDLIVLRTSGSGDYLEEVANALMAASGKGDLVSTALDWKSVLERALSRYGSEEFGKRLQQKGSAINDHRYIWMWTTQLVIRPQSQPVFYNLMSICGDLGFRIDGQNPEKLASLRLQQMKEIIRFHGAAGRKIRQALLERLRKLIEQRILIKDSYSLKLPDLSSGEISVFRVAAVDPKPVEIPYSRIGIIKSLES
jgi:hypothetical protein